MRPTGLPKETWKRITTEFYVCGHMLFINPRVLPGLDRNINKFITTTSSKN